jgi:hypothetical protein
MLAADDIVYCQPKKASHVNNTIIIITKRRVRSHGPLIYSLGFGVAKVDLAAPFW